MQNRGITLSVCASVLWGDSFRLRGYQLNCWYETWSAIGPGHTKASSLVRPSIRSCVVFYQHIFEEILSYFLPFSAFVRGGTCSCYLQSLLPCEDVKRDEAENNRRRIFTLSNWFASSSKPTFLLRSKVSSQTLPPSADHISTYATSSWSTQSS
jgi:hypothetical protein